MTLHRDKSQEAYVDFLKVIRFVINKDNLENRFEDGLPWEDVREQGFIQGWDLTSLETRMPEKAALKWPISGLGQGGKDTSEQPVREH